MKNIIIILFLLLFQVQSFCQFPFVKTWATYYFGGGVTFTVSKIDSDNNIVVAGIIDQIETPSFYNSFTTPNCHQPSINSANNITLGEIFLAKFTPSGSLIWATYYGGSNSDKVTAIDFDKDNNIYLTGSTVSVSGIATSGSFIPTFSSINTTSGFLAKFSTDGVLTWGTYLYERMQSLKINDNNEIYLIGFTQTDNNLATAGAFIENFENYTTSIPNENNKNAYIIKFDSNGSKLACSYLGRYSSNYFDCLQIDSVGNVVVIYSVRPDNGFYGDSTSFQATYSGTASLVLSKYNASLSQRIWSTYFGGNNFIRSTGLAIDKQNDDIYFSGSTNSTVNISTPNVHQTNLFSPAFDDSFMQRFNANGSRIWGTYFGGEGRDAIGSINIINNNVYFAGGTESATNIATAGAYQTIKISSINNLNSLFGSINKNTGTLNWASYFGISTVRILPQDNFFYLYGNTVTQTGITTPNSLQPNFAIAPGSTQSPPGNNIFLARFDPNSLATKSFTQTNLKLSPNPNRGSFSLQGNINNQNNLNLTIYDNLGRAVTNNKINVLDNNINQTFNLENVLTSGVYFAKLTNENQVLETFKVLIQ